jgi:hypothetical protein
VTGVRNQRKRLGSPAGQQFEDHESGVEDDRHEQGSAIGTSRQCAVVMGVPVIVRMALCRRRAVMMIVMIVL